MIWSLTNRKASINSQRKHTVVCTFGNIEFTWNITCETTVTCGFWRTTENMTCLMLPSNAGIQRTGASVSLWEEVTPQMFHHVCTVSIYRGASWEMLFHRGRQHDSTTCSSGAQGTDRITSNQTLDWSPNDVDGVLQSDREDRKKYIYIYIYS